MDEPTYVITMNFNRVELDAWIDQRKRAGGDYDLIGMGRRREYDSDTGTLVSDKTEPTGLKGWAPRDAIEPPSPSSWWERVFGAA
jgi:hypothetical protein